MTLEKGSDILVVVPIGDKEYAGWKLQTTNLIGRLRLKFRFILMMINSDADTYKSSTVLKRNNSRFLSKILFIGKVTYYLLKGSNKKLVVYFPFFFFPSSFIALLAWLLGFKYVCRISGSELRQGGQLATVIRYFCIRKAHSVICLNTQSASDLVLLGAHSERIYCIPNGVDTSRFMPPRSSDEKERIRDSLSISSNQFIVGYVGTVCQRKQTIELIRACSLVSRELKLEKYVTLVVVGPSSSSPETDCHYYNDCVKLAKSLGLNTIFFDFSDDIHYFYKSFDIFVLPSLSEGMPNALLEAMSSALPCLSTRIPGVVEIINTPEVGCLFEPGDEVDLMRNLHALISNKKLRNAISRSARNRILENYSICYQDIKYEKLFEEFTR